MDFPLQQASIGVYPQEEEVWNGAVQSPTTGGQKLMQMLTPRSLRLSLRGIGRTFTTLTRGVSQESCRMEPGKRHNTLGGRLVGSYGFTAVNICINRDQVEGEELSDIICYRYRAYCLHFPLQTKV